MTLPGNDIPDFDFHTHRHDIAPGRGIVCLSQDIILNIGGGKWRPREGGLYAAGVHPWWTAAEDFDLAAHIGGLETLLRLPEVVQVGECGIDRLRGAALECQRKVMEVMVEMSEEYGRPMTIHCVRAFDVLLAMRKQLRPQQRWTVHGFRGNATLARQLLESGMDLSFGKRFDTEAWNTTPPERRHRESDAE